MIFETVHATNPIKAAARNSTGMPRTAPAITAASAPTARAQVETALAALGYETWRIIDRAIQVHGGAGVTSDLPLERMYREARYARIYDGPDEVHRMVVARRLLRDPRGGAPWS